MLGDNGTRTFTLTAHVWLLATDHRHSIYALQTFAAPVNSRSPYQESRGSRMKERTEVLANGPMFPQVNNQMNTLVLMFYLFYCSLL